MNARQKLLATTTALGLAAGGLAIYSQGDPSGGGQRAAKVLAKGCDVVITAPAVDVTGTAKLSAGQSLAVTIEGKALRCPNGTVSVYASVGGGAESLLGTATVSAAGVWSYGPTTVTDNATTVLRAAMSSVWEDAARPTEARVVVNAATARPRVVLTTPAPDPGGRARIVAPAADGGCGSGGNPHAEKGEPGYYHDLSCAAGGQVSPVMTVYGASPGTLTATYGVTPLASVAVTTDPQTFTAAELGQWTLDDWTRDDLVVRVAKDGDAGVAETVVDLQVGTGSPPELTLTVTIIDHRHADVDVSFTLPATPAPVLRPHIDLWWASSTQRHQGNLEQVAQAGFTTITTTPTEVGTTHTALRSGVTVTVIGDAGVPGVYCAPSTTPDGGAGLFIAKATAGAVGGCGYRSDGGTWLDNPANDCCESGDTPVYCRTASGTANVTSAELGFCAAVTHDWSMATYTTSGYRVPNATLVGACWGDGTDNGVQLWKCHDGKSYRGGETYVEQIRWVPPLDAYYFHAQVTW